MASDSSSHAPGPAPARPAWQRFLLKFFAWTGGLALALVVAGVTIAGVALAVAYPNLPDISELADYRPKLPLRVYSSRAPVRSRFMFRML